MNVYLALSPENLRARHGGRAQELTGRCITTEPPQVYF